MCLVSMLALTPGKTSQLSKAERSKEELQRAGAQGIFCWQTLAVRSHCTPVLLDRPLHVVCVRYAVDTKTVSSV